MLYRYFSLAFLMFVMGAGVLSFPSSVRASVQEIVAVVNEEAISVSDLNKRMKLILVSSGLPNNKEMRARMGPQVLGGLVNERIMLQEARKMGFDVSPQEIEQGFATIAGQNQTTPDKFKSMIKKSGIDLSTLRSQIESQVAWGKVVQARLRPRVVVSERDIDSAVERLQSKIGTTEYLVAEIFLPVDDVKNQGKVKQLGERLYREIRGGKASFFKLAQQFSKAAGAARGGDTGWVNEGQIDEALRVALEKIKKNQVTQPVQTRDGYHLLFLRETRTLSEDTMPSRQQVEYNIGTDRLNKVQGRHLEDLRAASFIDVRLR